MMECHTVCILCRKRGLPVSSKRAGQPSVPPPESGGMSSGLGRQPSVKYTKDPQMQHYFPRAADLHQQPPFRYIYISYCVGYRAIWQVIARVCEVLPEPKARVILTHECNNSQYCPINHVISCLLPSSSSTWC